LKAVVETTTAAPPDIAFAAATDVHAWPRFMSKITTVAFVSGNSFVPGARFSETRTIHGRQSTEIMTIASVDPPRSFVLHATGHGARYVATTEILPRIDGGSGAVIRLTFEATPTTLLARLLRPLMRFVQGAVQRQLAADVADLAKEADRRASRI
jgi:hypothetical protein